MKRRYGACAGHGSHAQYDNILAYFCFIFIQGREKNLRRSLAVERVVPVVRIRWTGQKITFCSIFDLKDITTHTVSGAEQIIIFDRIEDIRRKLGAF